jgi:hypothetical protein
MYSYDRNKTAADGPVEQKLHKAFRDLQYAITDIDQVSDMKDIPPMAKDHLRALVKNLEASAEKLEFVESTIRIWEKTQVTKER